MIFLAWLKSEVDEKLGKIRSFMGREGIDYLLITTQTNFQWLTGGRPYVNPAVEKACGDLLIARDKAYLVANNIEAGRLLTEELPGLGFEKLEYCWWQTTGQRDRLKAITFGGEIIMDSQLGVKFAELRWDLTLAEQGRYRDTGKCVALALEEVAFVVKPGDSELTIAALIKDKAIRLGVNPLVTLVAADDRAFKYRHPLPTAKKIDNYVMLVLTGEKHGLFAAATRLVHFGPVPADIRNRHDAVLKVDAAFIAATVPGAHVKDIFLAGQKAYTNVGFADQWQYHHQGGMIGYNAREFKATADSLEIVQAGQVYAWNPSIAGVKSEDTFLIGNGMITNLTYSASFPTIVVEYGGITLKRPDILIR